MAGYRPTERLAQASPTVSNTEDKRIIGYNAQNTLRPFADLKKVTRIGANVWLKDANQFMNTMEKRSCTTFNLPEVELYNVQPVRSGAVQCPTCEKWSCTTFNLREVELYNVQPVRSGAVQCPTCEKWSCTTFNLREVELYNVQPVRSGAVQCPTCEKWSCTYNVQPVRSGAVRTTFNLQEVVQKLLGLTVQNCNPDQ